MCLEIIYIRYIYIKNLALHKRLWLIWHKIKPNQISLHRFHMVEWIAYPRRDRSVQKGKENTLMSEWWYCINKSIRQKILNTFASIYSKTITIWLKNSRWSKKTGKIFWWLNNRTVSLFHQGNWGFSSKYILWEIVFSPTPNWFVTQNGFSIILVTKQGFIGHSRSYFTRNWNQKNWMQAFLNYVSSSSTTDFKSSFGHSG